RGGAGGGAAGRRGVSRSTRQAAGLHRRGPRRHDGGGYRVLRAGEARSAAVKQAERNLVLLLSDMKGFTARTSGQTREENARMLALHDALLLPVVRGYRGRQVAGRGDARLAGVGSPTGAVRGALGTQVRVAAGNSKAPAGERIEMRIALSQGEGRRWRGDLHGEAAQLALEA